MIGTCSWWNRKKGYGFITSDDGTDLFVHYSDLDGCKNLKAKDRVEFKVHQDEDGAKAVNVRIIK